MARAKCAKVRAGDLVVLRSAGAEQKYLSLVLMGRVMGPNVYSGDVEEVEGF